MEKSKLNNVSDDEVQKVAKHLGVDLEESINEKTEEESISEIKTDTETDAGGNGEGTSEKSEDEVDYKKKYSESTKEFQEKYKPMEDTIKKLEQLSGKSFDDIVKAYEEVEKKFENKKDTPKDEKTEVAAKLSSLEDKIDSIGEKVSEQETKDKLSAKKQVDTFCNKYDISEDYYQGNIYPLLSGIKGMPKKNGDPYTLEEGLELAYFIVNKDSVDKIVEKKLAIKKKEEDLTFSPKGSQDSDSIETPEFSEQEKFIAKKMGVKLEEESDGK